MIMGRVRSKNTRPEMEVRGLLHRVGYRFRLHRTNLPGKPDIVLPRLRTVVFVHGCFRHRHPNCPKATVPASNVKYWADKFRANNTRDQSNTKKLRRKAWRVIVVWECKTLEPARLSKRLKKLLQAEDR